MNDLNQNSPLLDATMSMSLNLFEGNVMHEGFAFRWDFEDWEENNCHWRGPSWFGIKHDGSVEFGAAYLANMKRTNPISDTGLPRSFGVSWMMFGATGNRVGYGSNFLATGLKYKHEVQNTTRQWPSGEIYAEYVRQATRCTAQQVIIADSVPPGRTIPIIDIPWDPH